MADLFPLTSRYHGVPTAEIRTADGTTVIYLRRRFVPPADRFDLLAEHAVVAGDRLDNLAGAYLGNAELSWRICDANNAMDPDELTETVGRRLRITLPEGIPGPANV
jgi:hypothetical protein